MALGMVWCVWKTFSYWASVKPRDCRVWSRWEGWDYSGRGVWLEGWDYSGRGGATVGGVVGGVGLQWEGWDYSGGEAY